MSEFFYTYEAYKVVMYEMLTILFMVGFGSVAAWYAVPVLFKRYGDQVKKIFLGLASVFYISLFIAFWGVL